MTEHSLRPIQGGSRLSGTDADQMHPLVTILIVVFRDRDELLKIIQSVIPFLCGDLEIVVVDGFSQDGTIEALLQLGDRVAYWVSEPDRGIYDAMNKGLKVSRGTYILHLNAGDRLLEIPWDDLRRCAGDRIDVVCCSVLLDRQRRFVSRTSLLSKLDNTWHHQGTFYRREAHLGYDASYQMAADFDHNQRLLRNGCTIRDLPVIVADHESGGISMQETGHKEIYRSVRANFGPLYLQLSRLRFGLLDLRRWLRAKGL